MASRGAGAAWRREEPVPPRVSPARPRPCRPPPDWQKFPMRVARTGRIFVIASAVSPHPSLESSGVEEREGRHGSQAPSPPRRLFPIPLSYRRFEPVAWLSGPRPEEVRPGSLLALEVSRPEREWRKVRALVEELRAQLPALPLVLRVREPLSAPEALELGQRTAALGVRAVVFDGDPLPETLRRQLTDPTDLGGEVVEWLWVRGSGRRRRSRRPCARSSGERRSTGRSAAWCVRLGSRRAPCTGGSRQTGSSLPGMARRGARFGRRYGSSASSGRLCSWSPQDSGMGTIRRRAGGRSSCSGSGGVRRSVGRLVRNACWSVGSAGGWRPGRRVSDLAVSIMIGRFVHRTRRVSGTALWTVRGWGCGSRRVVHARPWLVARFLARLAVGERIWYTPLRREIAMCRAAVLRSAQVLGSWTFPILLLASGALAQERVEIPSKPSCPNCKITLSRVATLGRVTDPGSVMLHSRLVRDSRGQFYVAPTSNPGEIFVYDARGRYLRSLGRRGGGPGEFEVITELAIARGDTVHVFDGKLRRRTVISPDGAFVRSSASRGTVSEAVVRVDGTIAVNLASPDPELFGLPIHILDPSGRIVRSFGAAGATAGVGVDGIRHLARAGRDRIWSARTNRYELQLWDSSGRLLQTLVRDADWFQPWTKPAPGAPWESPPAPAIRSIWVDSIGRVWTVISVADKNWKPRPGQRSRGEGLARIVDDAGAIDRYFDTLIEVIDPEQGRVVARGRHPGHPLSFNDQGLLYGTSVGSDGDSRLTVWRVRLTRR